MSGKFGGNWPWTWIRHTEWTERVQRLGKFFESVPPERYVNSLEIPQRSPIRIIENYITVGTCVNYACAIDAPPVKLPSSLPRLFSNPPPSPIRRAPLSTVPFHRFLPSEFVPNDPPFPIHPEDEENWTKLKPLQNTCRNVLKNRNMRCYLFS